VEAAKNLRSVVDKLVKILKELIKFLKDVANDPKIPASDKRILLVLIGLIVSPVDIIPDWIPVVGVMDDFILIGIVLDYFFNHLDSEILLSHYPWGMKSFVRIRFVARLVARVVPNWVKKKIWKFEPNIYR
jgi:uncharacterized membrane protein YkvA (DUF1232 family)